MNLGDGDFVGLIVIVETEGGLGGEVEELADGGARFVAGGGFEPVAEGDEGEEAGGFHEVEVGEDGPPFCEIADEGDEAVGVGDGCAHGDEGVHVAGAVAESGEGGFVEGGAEVNQRDGAGDEGEIDGPELVMAYAEPVHGFDGEPEDEADDPAALPGAGVGVLAVEALFFGVGGGDGEVFGVGVVAGMLDGVGEGGGVGFGGVEADGGAASSEIYLCVFGAGDGFDGVLDVGDAGGAGHAFDVEGDYVGVGGGIGVV